MHDDVGPAKNLLQKWIRKRPARHEDIMLLCWGISFQWQKFGFGNLADSRFLLLKYGWNELRKRLSMERRPLPNINLHLVKGKSSCFLTFFDCFCELSKGLKLFAWRTATKGSSVAVDLSSRLPAATPPVGKHKSLFACKINIVILRLNNAENNLNVAGLGPARTAEVVSGQKG